MHEQRAWLLQSRINPFPISGELALTDGRLSFTLDETAAEARLGWLEEELGVEDLGRRIEAGEAVVAFDHPLSECHVSWPITGGGTQMVIRVPGRKWVVSYELPSHGAVLQAVGAIGGRRRAKEWKRAIAEAGG